MNIYLVSAVVGGAPVAKVTVAKVSRLGHCRVHLRWDQLGIDHTHTVASGNRVVRIH